MPLTPAEAADTDTGYYDWNTHGHDPTRTRGTCGDCGGVIDELGCDCNLPPAGSGVRPRT